MADPKEKPSCSTFLPSSPSVGKSVPKPSKSGSNSKLTSESPHTVLRLKRRIDEDPAQALLLSFKRCKGDDGWRDDDKSGKGGVFQRVIKLAATLTPDQTATSVAETISQVLTSPKSAVDRLSVKQRPIKLLDKSRSQFQETSSENRFRLISSKRGLDSPSELESSDNNGKEVADSSISKAIQDLYKLYDLEEFVDEVGIEVATKEMKATPENRPIGSITCNGKPMLSEGKKRTSEEIEISESKKIREENQASDKGYVYDLYITNEAIDNYVQDQRVCVNIYSEEFLTNQLYQEEGNESGQEEEAGGYYDEEDSNDEDNWRNDYPSDDPDGSENESDSDGDGEEMDVEGELSHLQTRFNKMKFKELSSDEEDEGNGLFGKSRYYMKQEKAEDEVVSSASDSD